MKQKEKVTCPYCKKIIKGDNKAQADYNLAVHVLNKHGLIKEDGDKNE